MSHYASPFSDGIVSSASVTVLTDHLQHDGQIDGSLGETFVMNKSMLIGVVAGLGVATAGGVAAFSLLGKSATSDQQVDLVERDAAVIAPAVALVETKPDARPALATQPPPATTPAPAPRRVAEPAPTQSAAQPVAQSASEPAPDVTPETTALEVADCTEGPKDQHAIAGTAIGAVVGGALGKEVGESDLSTAAGAAAGAFIGRRLQRRMQENRAEQQTAVVAESGCAGAAAP
jgi:uncharacterized protein YcfJ